MKRKRKFTAKRRARKLKLSRPVKIFLWCFLFALAGYDLYNYYLSRRPQEITVEKGKINTLKSMARLCSVEIYSESPVLDTINGKVMFAVQRQRGSISFDLENLRVDSIDRSDTLRVALPPEIVEIYESTEPGSWEVIDTKAVGHLAALRSGKFSVEEENAVKARFKQKSLKTLYTNGTVRRARAEAAKSLEGLMESVYRQPVIVEDPTPDGIYNLDKKNVKVR